MEAETGEAEANVCLGPQRSAPTSSQKTFTCILCLLEDELEVILHNCTNVYIFYVNVFYTYLCVHKLHIFVHILHI
jgi:hypothetical protein